jgi:uncharacterized protein YdaU (DUF1376 family)
MNWYKFDPVEHNAAVAHLGLADDLCYRRLMDVYYLSEKPLVQDVGVLAGHIQMESEIVAGVLEEFFKLTDRGWEHERIQKDIDARLHRRRVNQRSGKMGGRPRTQTED